MSEWKKVELGETWNFKKEKELIGTYTGCKKDVGPNKSMLYNFKKTDGSMVSVWGNTVLDTRFQSLEFGTEIKIVYLGLAKSPSTGREYHNFEVFYKEEEIEEEPPFPSED